MKAHVMRVSKWTLRDWWCIAIVLVGGRRIGDETGYRVLALYDGEGAR